MNDIEALARVFDQEQRNREIMIARLEMRIAEHQLMLAANREWAERLKVDYPMLAKQHLR